MTYHEFEAALIVIIAPLHDLKERVLVEGMHSPNDFAFDGGMLAAHAEGLMRMLDENGEAVQAEISRQVDARLRDALGARNI